MTRYELRMNRRALTSAAALRPPFGRPHVDRIAPEKSKNATTATELNATSSAESDTSGQINPAVPLALMALGAVVTAWAAC